MWSNKEDLSTQGESIRIFVPAQGGRKPKGMDESFIGGLSTVSDKPFCKNCKEKMKLLVHFIEGSPFDVYACNNASCFDSLFLESKLNFGGGGVVSCMRCRPIVAPKVAHIPPGPTPSLTANIDWGDETHEQGMAMDELEAKLAAMETKPFAAKKKFTSSNILEGGSSEFPCVALVVSIEPIASYLTRAEDMDEDDVGYVGGESDEKIQNMLARYMAEEDDSEILSALRGQTDAGEARKGGTGKKEKDERLSASDRALRFFMDRIRRSPRQILRYAPGGEPLWSIPTYSPSEKAPRSQPHIHRTFHQLVPLCSCGKKRFFVVQILPSILNDLKVDKFVEGNNEEVTGIESAFSSGGMNFGNIAVYSCTSNCQPYVVVQDSVDDRPIKPTQSIFMDDISIVIDENTKFDDEDEVQEHLESEHENE